MEIKLINVGYGNFISSSRIIAIIGPESAPVKRIIQECYAKATGLIKEHEDVLHKCAELLLEKEKIGRAEFEALFGGDPIPQPEEEGVVVEGI